MSVPSCEHVSDLVSWEGSEENQMSSLHQFLPLWPEVEVFGFGAASKEQDVVWRARRHTSDCEKIHSGSRGDAVTWVKLSPVLSSAILSCIIDLNGATPVPGPTIITGVSLSAGNFRLPFFTHRGTNTSPDKVPQVVCYEQTAAV